MPLFLRLAKRITAYKLQIAGGVFFMITYALFTVAPAKYIKNVIDSLSSGKVPDLKRFILIAAAIVLIFLFKGISYFGQIYLMGGLGQRFVTDLRNQLFEKITLLSFSFYAKRTTGDLISRFTIDLTTLEQAVINGITGPLRDVPQIFMLLGLMYVRSWQLFLVTIVLIPPAAFMILKFGEKNKRVTSKRQLKYGDLTSYLSETISGVRVVQAFNMQEYENERFSIENNRLYRLFLKAIRINAYSFPILELTGAFCGAIVLTYGGYLIIHGHITGGDFASFIVSFFMLNDPIKKFNGFNLKIQEGLSAAERVYDILDTDTMVKEKENAIVLPHIQKEIHIKIDQFSYREKIVLRNIDLKVAAGSIVALVGVSGSGKTTLVNLIPRFYDIPENNGYIKIDGVNLLDTKLHSLRKQIAIVTQDIVLFSDSVKNNIAYGKIKCSAENIINSAKMAYAHDFIMNLPNGYDEQVGEKGVKLSGGQRQRLAIARALIKDAPILILDEATSALDTESEVEIQAAIENLMKNRTTFVIAHRLSTIQHADKICVLKSGEIVESGTHEELLDLGKEYLRLYELQFRG